MLRAKPNVMIVAHRLGFVMANAGIDEPNIGGAGRVLLLPVDPDRSCRAIKQTLDSDFSVSIGVVINDSFGRAWRTVIYTLSGLSDEERGWGRAGESWNFMEATRQLGGESWLSLGDRDLALHVERTRRLAAGETLTQVIAGMARTLRIGPTLLPVTDDRLSTKVETAIGTLDFQRYFVEHRCEPALRALSFEGAPTARLGPQVAAALASPRLGAVIICPSNPYLSIDPMMAISGLHEAIRASGAPVVAVSPIIGGRAIKGPTAKIMRELAIAPTSASIAQHYAGLIDGLLIDSADAADAAIATRVAAVPTLMTDLASRIALAREALAFVRRLSAG